MAIETIRKEDIVRNVPKRWANQYSRGNDSEDKSLKTRLLQALPEGFSAEQVDQIVGNHSWTSNECDECGNDCAVLVRIGQEPDYDARWVNICQECISTAQAALDNAP